MRRSAITVAVLLLWAATAQAGPDGGAAIDAATCATCHDKLTKGKKTIHGVFGSGGCNDCHTRGEKPGKCKSPLTTTGWKLTEQEPKLCQGCHEPMVFTEKGTIVHAPIDSLGCTACHDPHATDTKTLLKAATPAELCAGCHDRKDDKKAVHSAVKKGTQCLGCHEPHASKIKALLKKPAAELCATCHKPDALLKHRNKHAPVVDGACLSCHDPHATDFPKQTLAAGSALCMRCHDAKLKPTKSSPMPKKRIDLGKKEVHKPLEMGDCQDCHEAGHSSPFKNLLKKSVADTCYECHDRQDTKASTHGAVKVGDCAVCHEPHSTNNQHLLRKASIKETCFTCHQDDLTGRKFLHKPAAEGKCDACHEPHGAADPFNLKIGAGPAACLSCHTDKGNVKNKHKALERYGCTVCHDPHGTANRFMLAKPVNKLCQTCHADKVDGLHITNMVRGGHVISGPRDPRCVDRELTCASCHDPHGSDRIGFAYVGDTMLEECDGCHGDRTGKRPALKNILALARTPAGKPGATPQGPPPAQLRCPPVSSLRPSKKTVKETKK